MALEVLMIGHTFLFNSAYQRMQEQVQTEAFGKLHYLYSRRTNLGPIRPDTSCLWARRLKFDEICEDSSLEFILRGFSFEKVDVCDCGRGRTWRRTTCRCAARRHRC